MAEQIIKYFNNISKVSFSRNLPPHANSYNCGKSFNIKDKNFYDSLSELF